jgi:hypothetical protein
MATSTPGMSAPKRIIDRAGFAPGEELRVRLVHLFVEVGPCEQHGDLHHAIERAPGSFQDGLGIALRDSCARGRPAKTPQTRENA